MEKVIFRIEYNPYTKRENFLAIFPDDPARPGNLCFVPFYPANEHTVIFEAFGECSYKYYRDKTKRVRKNSPEAEWCKKIIESRYGSEYRVMEKITR